MNKRYVIIALALGVVATSSASGQRRTSRRSGGRSSATAQRTRAVVEPLRALGGSMVGKTIKARHGAASGGFDFTLTGARLLEGKLLFDGVFSEPDGSLSAGEAVSATLVGTLSRSRHPRPGSGSSSRARAMQQAARQPQGREARGPEAAGQISQLSQATQSTARTTPPAPAPEGNKPPAPAGGVTEQTQSLYTAVETGSGCEVMFLKMELPARRGVAARASHPVQLGVVLAPTDNKAGEEINWAICRVVRMRDEGRDEQEIGKQLAQLNNLLAGGK